MSKVFHAELIHGQTYVIGRRKFEFGIPQVVDEKLADYLTENAHANELVTSGSKKSRRKTPKFKITEVNEAEDEDEVDEDEASEVVTKPAKKTTKKAPAKKSPARSRTRAAKATDNGGDGGGDGGDGGE